MNNAIVSSYKIIKPLGYGGTGIVYVAQSLESEDNNASDQVALKLKSKEMRAHDIQNNPFKHEYELLATMHRANPAYFVRPMVCDTDEARHFLAMELMDETLDKWGEGLREELANGLTAQTFAVIASRLRACVEAIGTAHALGYIVRDVSSRNFLIKGDQTKATDLSSAIPMSPTAVHRDTRVTARYASHNVAHGCPAHYGDDYEALCYVWIDVLTDRLPWRKCKRLSAIQEIKTACLRSPADHYAHLPRLFHAMLPLETATKEGVEGHQERRKMLLELTNRLEIGELSSFISEFRDTSQSFSQYHGLF